MLKADNINPQLYFLLQSCSAYYDFWILTWNLGSAPRFVQKIKKAWFWLQL